MIIYCCQCQKDVDARLTCGAVVYPWRLDLAALPFWRCDDCDNFVGCHHKTAEPTKPLGVIAGPAMKNARQHIHALIDPLWKQNRIGRKELYKCLSKALGREYHTADLRTLDEARAVYREAKNISIQALDDRA
jgi:hypothetical protein